jgi:glucosamine-6-phosphate deaminase
VRVRVFHTPRQVAAALASRLVDCIRSRPRVTLGLPTGRTPVELYRCLTRLHAQGTVDFAHVTTFNLDEFYGIPPGHPGSFRTFMEQHLFGHVNVPRDAIHFLDGAAPDPEAECARYERAIAAAGGIDLQVVGIGTNGHIGFNEPGPELEARTHRVTLTPETRRANAALFGADPGRVPPEALSMGMGTILQARSLVLIATGRTKAGCIERVVQGRVTTSVPASFLQLHGDVELYLDEGAAERLPSEALADPDVRTNRRSGE